MTSTDDELIDTRSAATELGLTIRQLYALIDNGELPAVLVKVNPAARHPTPHVTRADLDRYLLRRDHPNF